METKWSLHKLKGEINMLNFLRNSRSFIMNDEDVTTVLTVIDKHLKVPNGVVSTCGWAKQPEKWFITFKCSGKEYSKLIKDLISIGTIEISVRPGGLQDLYFKRA